MRCLVLGGNRFFGRHLVAELLRRDAEVTLMYRGNIPDPFGDRLQRVIGDRHVDLDRVAGPWDVVFDQIGFDAESARTLLAKIQAEHWVFTSSQSVYGWGANLQEAAFEPTTHHWVEDVPTAVDYAEGKRQAEAVMSRVNALIVRPPIVFGDDDPTKRLQWHIRHIVEKIPFYCPAPHARIGFADASELGTTIARLGLSHAQGPVNVAAAGAISLTELFARIAKIHGGKAVYLDSPEPSHESPFGIDQDWFMSVDRLTALDRAPRPLLDWLDGRIAATR